MNRIAIHHADHEGAFHIDAENGRLVSKITELPAWAEGYAMALLKERSVWYTARLGAEGATTHLGKELADARDFGWIGLDAEGDTVEIECDNEYRMNVLSELLNLDREDHEQEDLLARTLAKRDIEHTYVTQPTDEATLEELEGASFEEVKAVNQ
jgi:hypothetical protein